MSVPVVAGVYLGSAGLLGLAGVAKLVAPGDTAIALRAHGFPAGILLVRLGAAAEVALAVVAVVVGGAVPAGLMALSFAGFAGFVALALVRGWPLASCGCFGRADTAPTLGHVVVNVAAAVAAVWWAVAGAPGIHRVLAHQPVGGLGLVVTSVSLALVALVVFVDPVTQARHRPGRP